MMDKKERYLFFRLVPATQASCDMSPIAENEEQDYHMTLETLNTYFLPQKKFDLEIFQFLPAKQHVDEATDQVVACLRKLAVQCEFTDLEKELKATVLQSCLSDRCLTLHCVKTR